MPERVALAPALRCGEWLRAMRALRGLAPADWAAAVAASGLDPAVLGRAGGTLSKGMLQRVALLEALRADCPLLLLDEPFAGLDADGRDWLAAELAGRMAEGAAVLLTDHSDAARGRIALAGALRLRRRRVPAGGGGAPAGRELLVRAAHPDGRRAARAVARGRGRRPAARAARRGLARRGGPPVSGIARYLVLCATRTRAPLPALAAALFLVIGVFFYPRNEVGATWGLTALLSCGLAAWLVGAVLAGEPPAQADMATAALGGRRRRAVLGAAAVGRRRGAAGASRSSATRWR